MPSRPQIFNLFFILFAARITYVYNQPDALAERRRPAHSIDRCGPVCVRERPASQPSACLSFRALARL